jgi:hypothetical protein
MKNIQRILDKIRFDIEAECFTTIDLIVDQNARVENYFSVLILKSLSELKGTGEIISFELQYLLSNKKNKRHHFDFCILCNTKRVLMEVKHCAIDEKPKNNRMRTFKFYTSTSKVGKKIGIVGDFNKLDTIKKDNADNVVSFAIITNPPSDEIINKVIQSQKIKKESSNWSLNYFTSKLTKLSFLISIK